jgi:transcriptional regulator with XRE-family HTH domain
MNSRHVRYKNLATALALEVRPRYLIAALAGMPPQQLSLIVSGKRAATLRQRDNIAEVLGLDVKHLFRETRES